MITAFGDFVGREELVSSLERMSEEENVPGAVLIGGQRGSGKKTLAKSLAAAILCKSREKRPCGVCSSCKKARAVSRPIPVAPPVTTTTLPFNPSSILLPLSISRFSPPLKFRRFSEWHHKSVQYAEIPLRSQSTVFHAKWRCQTAQTPYSSCHPPRSYTP